MGPLKFGSYFLDSPVVKNNKKKTERYNRFVTVVVETKTGNNRLYTVGTIISKKINSIQQSLLAAYPSL